MLATHSSRYEVTRSVSTKRCNFHHLGSPLAAPLHKSHNVNRTAQMRNSKFFAIVPSWRNCSQCLKQNITMCIMLAGPLWSGNTVNFLCPLGHLPGLRLNPASQCQNTPYLDYKSTFRTNSIVWGSSAVTVCGTSAVGRPTVMDSVAGNPKHSRDHTVIITTDTEKFLQMKRLLSAFELLIAAVDSRTARHPCDQDTRF